MYFVVTMEEIEYKLKQKNAILIFQAISKLVEIIKTKNDDSKTNKNISDTTELELLKSKCGCEDPTVSITASHGIVSLVENGILPIGPTLSDLMIILSTANYHNGITIAIGNLLLLDLRRSIELNKNYSCPFQIQKPQHPLITILAQNKDIWMEIFNQIQSFINHYDDKIALNSVEILRPVFFYVLCDPDSKLHSVFRKQLWSLLTLQDNNIKLKLLTFEILSWIQNNSKEKCLEVQDFLIETAKFAVRSENHQICSAIILYLTAIINKLLKYGCDPTLSISVVNELLEITKTQETHSVILFILAEAITITPSIYLSEILRLCKTIILKQSSNLLAVKAVVSSILQWILHPSPLLSDSIKLANETIIFIENNQTYSSFTGNLYRDKYFKYIQFIEPNIDLSVKLCLLAEKWQTNEKNLVKWLEWTLNSPITFLLKVFTFVSAIFIHRFKTGSKTALDILLKMVENKPELSFNVLVLILHKLTIEPEPEIQIALLKAIPLMAVSKQNIPLIISTLAAIKNGNISLKTISFDLYLRLWSTEVRCFPFLHKLLLIQEDNWEFGIAKAHTLKEICIQRSDLHGKEMAVHLSQILNKYGDHKGSIASAVALEGIIVLCENGIIDKISTWKNISPRFAKEKRPAVIKSLCALMSELATIDSSDSSDNEDEVVNEVICKLWDYVLNSEYVDVIEAALKAISKFNVEQISLKQLPDLYRQRLKLPSSYAKTPVDAARRPEDVLPYIPGECWIQLLQNINHDAIQAAGDLLIEWIQDEIADYKSSVYKLPEGVAEPSNYSNLPPKSIIQALTNYIRLITIPNSKYHFSENVTKQILRILGKSYSKPLPPIDWSFLLDLFHKKVYFPGLCINLLSKQLLISASARKLVENFIAEFQPNLEKVNEIEILFSNLTYLCKGIAPNTLRPMITNSLNLIHQNLIKSNSDDEDLDKLFSTLVEHLKNALLDENIHEANRTLLCQIIETFTEELDANTKIFDCFLNCIVETSSKFIERISSPSLWWETTQEKFEKAIKVRCALALKSKNKPLVFLNECINNAATLPSSQISILKQMIDVFRFHAQNPTTCDWILELLGQIQEKLTNEEKNPDEITFLCDVFLVAVIVFSGYDCLSSQIEMVAVTKEVRLNLFPSAVFSFISERNQQISLQIMEWLYHMTEACMEIPSIYKTTFHQSLITLRHEKTFCETSRWMKYVSIKNPN